MATASRSATTVASQQRARQGLGMTALCGGIAGMTDALCCHPLDTIKVRMQTAKVLESVPLNVNCRIKSEASFAHVIRSISQESASAFYRGLGAVTLGIIPKMAVRFTGFELYASLLKNPGDDQLPPAKAFLAGIAAGVTEAVVVVTPMDVVKIRMQSRAPGATLSSAVSRPHSLSGTIHNIVKTGGLRALWSGVGLTAMRQGSGQAVNFYAYSKICQYLKDRQPAYQLQGLPSWQIAIAGFGAGSLGPLFNAPIDTMKTRIQRLSPVERREVSLLQLWRGTIAREGYRALWRGISARILRLGLGQSVTFCTYELLRKTLLHS